jgi:hypothetical protein
MAAVSAVGATLFPRDAAVARKSKTRFAIFARPVVHDLPKMARPSIERNAMEHDTPDHPHGARTLSAQETDEIAGGDEYDTPSLDGIDMTPIYDALVDATSALIEAVDSALK